MKQDETETMQQGAHLDALLQYYSALHNRSINGNNNIFLICGGELRESGGAHEIEDFFKRCFWLCGGGIVSKCIGSLARYDCSLNQASIIQKFNNVGIKVGVSSFER